MSIKCPECQTDNPDTQKFCGECGTQLIPSEELSVKKTMETPIQELTRGAIFAGRYEIIEELGSGGLHQNEIPLNMKSNNRIKFSNLQ